MDGAPVPLWDMITRLPGICNKVVSDLHDILWLWDNKPDNNKETYGFQPVSCHQCFFIVWNKICVLHNVVHVLQHFFLLKPSQHIGCWWLEEYIWCWDICNHGSDFGWSVLTSCYQAQYCIIKCVLIWWLVGSLYQHLTFCVELVTN